MDAEAAKERAAIIANARRIKSEIEQIFNDVAHWNRAVRTPFEEPIDPDPDGQLARMLAGINRMLANERPRRIVAK